MAAKSARRAPTAIRTPLGVFPPVAVHAATNAAHATREIGYSVMARNAAGATTPAKIPPTAPPMALQR